MMDKTVQYLREYFDQGPEVNCEGCTESCCGATRMTQQELTAILELLAKKGYKEAPRGKGVQYCEYLDKDGKCVVYEERPILCRVHGKMDGLYTTCYKNGNMDASILSQPPELLDYVENNILFLNTAGKELVKKYE